MDNQVFYEDEDTIVSSEALILEGERIPMRRIRRVTLEPYLASFANRLNAKIDSATDLVSEWFELKIELDGVWKKTRTIVDVSGDERLKKVRDAVMKAMSGKV
jgi:hypothetical protein